MGAILSLSASLTILASRGLWEHPCGEAERDLQAAVPFASAFGGDRRPLSASLRDSLRRVMR